MTDNVKPLRTYNTKVLADTYNTTAQMQANIEKLLVDDKTIMDLPNSLVPTDTLYAIVLCYDAMYKLLLDYDLVKTGNNKHSSSTLH